MEGDILDLSMWTQPVEGHHDVNFDFTALGEDYQHFDLTSPIPLSGSSGPAAINTIQSLSTTPAFQILPNIPPSLFTASASPPSPVQIFGSPTVTFPAVFHCSWCGQVTGTAFTSGASMGTTRLFNKDNMTNTLGNPQLRWNDFLSGYHVGTPFNGSWPMANPR